MIRGTHAHQLPALRTVLARLVACVIAIASLAAAQQNPPVLQIISPIDGTIVNPGQVITVSVTSPANASFSGLTVIGEKPIGFSNLQTSVPAQFSLTIPTDINCGPHALTVVGVTTSGQNVGSTPIQVDVERPDMPTALNPQIPSLSFKALGEQFPLVMLATFSDGSVLDVTESSNVTYSSSNTSVATVDGNGMVTGGSAGSATIITSYTLSGQSITTTVPVTVPPPVMTVSPTSLSFGSENLGAGSSPQQLTVTNTGNGSLKMLGVAAAGDFSETDNCTSSSPLPVSGTCTIDVSFMPTGAGARTGSITITNGTISIPSTVSLTGTGIGQPTTVTSVASSANPAVFGQSVTLTATVSPTSGSGTPTGTVTFSEGSTTLGSESLTNGQAAFTTSTFSVGSHSIAAAYSGDSTFQSSIGNLTETVNQASTTTILSSSANPSILNGTVTLTATVSVVAPGAGTPTGSIAFKDSSTVLTTVPINSAGQATFFTFSLAAGSHSVTAAYSGDSNFNGSTSATLNQSVQYEPAGTACDGDAGHQILQPISADGSSVFKQGQTIPAKFRVCDVNGVSIGTSGVVSSFLLTQIMAGTVTTTVQDIVDTNNPDTAFRWDPTNQQWIFNISTQNLSANSTYVYTITLNDGTVITFQYGLR